MAPLQPLAPHGQTDARRKAGSGLGIVRLLALGACCLVALQAPLAGAQEGLPPESGLTDEQTATLLRHRAGVENTADSEGTRQGQAEALLRTGWPAAADLLIEMLESTEEPSTQVVICRAVAHLEATQPQFVDTRLVEPLVRLLGDADPVVSVAITEALASFRDASVIAQLGKLSQDSGRPLVQRVAVIEALAANIDRRVVIEQLIGLTADPESKVRERALVALARASRVDYGGSDEAWEAWWQEKSALDENAWLADRVQLFAQRTTELNTRLAAQRRESERRYQALARRMVDVLRLTYRLTAQQAQKDELLTAWLADPLVDLRRTAVDLIREQIYDQQRPSEAVRQALRDRYTDRSPDLRREVLELVAALNDPAEMDAILARLSAENDASVRETILGVLGKLRNPGAIPVLISEISDESASVACVTGAARSLSTLARVSEDPAQLASAVTPLLARMETAGPDDYRLREALLEAMAAIGLAEFAPQFLAHLDSDRPELVLPAIRGVVAMQGQAHLDHLWGLCQHADARVRLEAIRALGALGEGQRALEALMNHLNPITEPRDTVRDAAWEALNRILRSTPAETRLQWAGRLKDLPARQIDYLTTLVDEFANASPEPVQLHQARDLLARLLYGQGRYAEAVRHLQDLYTSLKASDDPTCGEVGVLLLSARLRNG
ncbi:MAG: HEAT repeat domain-containing protein, partial [bacterium]|nr:HEAT repeat domain-containing protein [bacterium]